MATTTIGKTKVSLDVEVCTYCGTTWSRAGQVVTPALAGRAREIVAVRIGSRDFEIQIHACADCVGENLQPQLL